MSVLIKGITVPKDCPMCPMAHYDTLNHFRGCEVVPGKRHAINDPNYANTSIRPDWCPLIELPPHGRLIDADALMETFRERKRPTLSDGEDGSKERVRYLDFISTLQAIKDAPTIIETEEES